MKNIVVRVMKAYRDEKEKFILKDKRGKVHFLHNDEKFDEDYELEEDKFYLVEVVFSKKNFGLVRTRISGMLICDLIKHFKNEFDKADKENKQIKFANMYDDEFVDLVNRIFNHDVNFERDLMYNKNRCPERYYVSETSEIWEFRNSAVQAMYWLTQRFKKQCKLGEDNGK